MMNERIVYVSVIIVTLCSIISLSGQAMELKEVYPTLGLLGEPIESLELAGEGFSTDMQVSLSLARFKSGSIDFEGSAKAVATLDTLGSKAYVAAGNNGLRIMDITDPRSPIISQTLDLGGNVSGIAINGTNLIAVIGDVGDNQSIKAVHLRNPPDPDSWEVDWEVDVSEYNIYDIAVSGHFIYLAAGAKGLLVLDSESPDTPFETVPGITSYAYKVTVTPSWIYTAPSADEILAFKRLRTENTATHMTTIPLVRSTQIKSLAAQGDSLYVLYGFDEFTYLDVFDVVSEYNDSPLFSLNLVEASSICVNSMALMVTVEQRFGSFHIFNLGDTASPQFDGTLSNTGYFQDIALIQPDIGASNKPITYACILKYDPDEPQNSEFFIASLEDPLHPAIPDQDSIINISNPSALVVHNDTAYISRRDGGLSIFDIHLPGAPSNIDEIENINIIDMAVSEDALYLLLDDDDDGTIRRYGNVDNEGNIELTDHEDFKINDGDSGISLGPNSIDIMAHSAFVTGATQLVVIDCETGAQTMINAPTDGGTLVDVSMSNGYACIPVNNDTQSWLWIVDAVAESQSYLNTLSLIELQGGAQKAACHGSNIFVPMVGSWLGHMLAIDISNPNRPFIYDTIVTESNNRKAAVSDDGTLVCVLNDDAGMIVTPAPVLTAVNAVAEEGTQSFLSLKSPAMEGDYNLNLIANQTIMANLTGALSFRENAMIFKSRALIVAGGGPDAPGGIWSETKHCANKAYDALLKQGYHYYDILYLSMECMEQADEDMVARWPATLANLEYALTSWVDDETRDLLIYFVDHGEPGSFILDVPQSENDDVTKIEKLDADTLSLWLDQLQGEAIDRRLTFIYDACYSGSFIPRLLPPAGMERTLITSCASTEKALFGKNEDIPGGESFSHHFWSRIYLNGNIGDAFDFASSHMAGYQKALMDVNGNGVTNDEDDMASANGQSLRRGHSLYVIQPGIDQITVAQDESPAQLVITAKGVTDAQWVTAHVIPPNSDPEASPINSGYPEVRLEFENGNDIHQGVFEDATVNGTYVVSVSAGREEDMYSFSGEVSRIQTISSNPLFAFFDKTDGVGHCPGDDFEEDNSRETAHPIILNSIQPQSHTFHVRDDEDWIVFYGLEGYTYNIEAAGMGMIGNTILTLYREDSIEPFYGPVDDSGDGMVETIEFESDESLLYYLRITNANSHFGSSARYELLVSQPVGAVLSVMVSGIVKGPDSIPLPKVRIFTDEGNSAVSNGDGLFQMRHQEGNYTLTLVSDQYGTRTTTIKLVSGQDNSVDFTFDRSKTNQPETPGGGGGGGGGGCFISVLGQF